MNFRFILKGIFSSLSLMPRAFAQDIPDPSEAIDVVGGPLDSSIGGAEFGGIAEFLATTAIPLIFAFALFFIIRSSFILIYDQGEDYINKTKNVIIACITAIIATVLAGAIREAMLEIPSGGSVGIVETEVMGLVSWIEVLVAVIAITVIIISGIKAIANFGNEEGLAQLRRTVVGVIIGIILIVFKFALCGSIVFGTPVSGACFSFLGLGGGIVGTGVYILNVVVSFIALVAVAIVVYAGFMMIANIGNDDQYSKAKSLIGRVAIGILIVLVSTAIVNIVANLGTGGGGFFFTF